MIVFIILGIILLVVSFTVNNSANPLSKFSNLLKIIGVLLLLIGVFFFDVQANRRG